MSLPLPRAEDVAGMRGVAAIGASIAYDISLAPRIASMALVCCSLPAARLTCSYATTDCTADGPAAKLAALSTLLAVPVGPWNCTISYTACKCKFGRHSSYSNPEQLEHVANCTFAMEFAMECAMEFAMDGMEFATAEKKLSDVGHPVAPGLL